MLVDFQLKLQKVKFVKRYKRFFVDVQDDVGAEFPVHCANSGSMKSCLVPDCDAYILDSMNPERKLRHSLELMQLEDGLACLNTQRANQVTDAFLRALVTDPDSKKIEFEGSDLFSQDFQGTFDVKREAKYNEGTRFDFCLSQESKTTWLEVKSVSLRLDNQTIAFPDAVTDRGQKHLKELMHAVTLGHKAILFFVVMRGSLLSPKHVFDQFRAASEIDPKYAEMLSHSVASGVQVRLLVADINLTGIGVRGYFKYSR